MKRSLILVLGIFVALFAVAQNQEAEKKGPKIVFEETSFDFGDIFQGDQVEHVFTFENSGTEPLILTNVSTTCGCTVPKWPRQPIAPGETAELLVKFNSAGKMGKVNKVIKVISNASNPNTQVTITTNILPKKVTGTN